MSTLCVVLPSVMENQELVGFYREFRVRPSVVVGEFNLVGAVQKFHERANLTTKQTMLGQI